MSAELPGINFNLISAFVTLCKPVHITYPRWAVETILKDPDKSLPLLRHALKDRCLNASSENDFGDEAYPIIMILAYLRDRSAHGLITQILRKEELMIDRFFGDLLAEFVPMALFKTSGGDFTEVKELLLDRNAYDFSRATASTVLLYGVVHGMIDRDELIKFGESLFTGEEAEPGSYFWTDIIHMLIDLDPSVEMLEKCRDYLRLDFIDDEWLERDLRLDELNFAGLPRVRSDYDKRDFTVHEEELHGLLDGYLVWSDDDFIPGGFVEEHKLIPDDTRRKRRNQDKRARRKLQKQSKKKNRR